MTRRAVAVGVLLLAAAAPLAAQTEPVPAELSLTEAIEIALRNNPTHLQALNDDELAEWDVRQARGQLYLPSASASTSFGWQGTGDQQFGSITLGDLGFGEQPSIYSSSFNIGLSYSLNLATLLGPRAARAQRSATEARIRLSGAALVSQVTNAYTEVLRREENLALAEQQLENSRVNLRLAQGQLEVGAVTPIDVGQAEVVVGRAEVQVLQARNAVETARMRLLQQLGVAVDQEVELTTEFVLAEPRWELDELLATALARNPDLVASRRSVEAADYGVRQARSSYFPTLSISTGVSGFAREAANTDFEVAQAQARVAQSVSQCVQTNELYRRLADPLPPLDCGRFAFTDAQRNSIVRENDKFPFSFTRSPPSVSVGLSVPIFQGFSRQRNLEAARVQREDLRHELRQRELALRADLAVGLANLRTAYQSALLEERNRDLAEQQLRLARERYQLGLITFVELVDAQTVLVQAQLDLSTAVFAYHDALTALEALVGADLRESGL